MSIAAGRSRASAHCAIDLMAAHYRRDGPSLVKDAGSAAAAEGARRAILDERWPPGTLAAKR